MTLASKHTADLPATGFVRLADLVKTCKEALRAPILPFSAATLWRKVKSGEFPAPVKLSERITAWRVEDIREWLRQFSAA